MNYIYDVFLNFNYKLYDFYEWNKNDNIIHIKKIPLFKINDEVMKCILNNNIKIDKSFLNKIINKTETFGNIIKYACIFATNECAVGIKIDKGITYSTMLINEEQEVLEYIRFLEEEKFDYVVVSNKENSFLTRKEVEIKKYINNKINNLIVKKEYNKLKYIYLECFDRNADIDYIVDNILNELDNNSEVYHKIYNLEAYYGVCNYNR